MISTSAASTQRSSGLAPWRYRPDIDALRGIAVLAVFAYHLDERWLPGGFTGVDVFFVISGYVVSGSLLNHQEQPFWQQLGGFYQRRIRRLVPNLLCNIAVTSLAIALLVPPEESRGLFTTAVKALYGWSNNHLALGATDYFGLDAHLNPLSHTWSLGVEEQFYLVFPLLLLFLWRWRRGRWLIPGLSVLVTVSLLLSLLWTRQDPVLAFFLMPSRFWELSAGVLLLLAQRSRWCTPRSGSRLNLPLRWVGFALLLVALVATPNDRGFPLPGALPAVLGTLALLQAGAHWGVLQRPLVQCGLISYSLYLWHWPVLTLMRWTTGLEQPSLLVVAVLVSLLLAWLAYRLVEQPLRRAPWPAPLQLGLSLVAVVLTWAGVEALAHLWRGQWFLGRRQAAVPPSERFSSGDCTVPPWAVYGPSSRTDFSRCGRPGDPSRPALFLLGDSHALHLLPMLEGGADRTGQALSYSFKGNCLISPDLIGTYRQRRFLPCRDFAAGELDRARQRLDPGDVVVIANWFNRYLGAIDTRGRPIEHRMDAGGPRLRVDQIRKRWIESLRRQARLMAQQGIQLVLVVDVPGLRREPTACEAWRDLRPDLDPSTLCAPPAALTATQQQLQRDALAAVAAGLSNVHVFDPTAALLKQGRVQHRLSDGRLRYFDTNHLTVSASRELVPQWLVFLERHGLDGGNAR